MDIARPPQPQRPPWAIIATVVVLVALTVGFSRLRPAAPTVERSTLWVDKVQRGPMLRQVRGSGTLVPEQIRWVSAVTAGRVERVFVRPGAHVDSTDTLLELTNPDVQLEALDADRQLALAEAERVSLTSQLTNNELSQQSAVATAHAELMESQRAVATAEKLAADQLISSNELERARDRVTEMRVRDDGERQRLEVMRTTSRTQLELQREQVSRLRAISRFHEGRVASMRVRAGTRGVLQELSLEEGQWVNPGALLAKVAQPERLKAALRVSESQARDVVVGQPATIDTHNGTIAGHVSRIDPAVQAGTVAVDIALDGALPRGARPDLSVDGVIELERLANVLHVGRPADAQPNTPIALFRLQGRDGASRVQVRVGRASVNAVEVLGGLAEGDEVVLSDMSRWDGVDRLHIR